MRLLDGKVVFITGGARGQGRAHALVSARAGAKVVVVDIADQLSSVPYAMAKPEDLDETVALVEKEGGEALAVRADVRSQDQLDAAVAAALERFGQIDSLIANAGIWTMAPYWELSEEMWSQTIETNLAGIWRSAKAVTPHMIERGTGSIVVISSVNGIEPGMNYAHYTSAKSGALGLMKVIALEGGRHGIRCNAICPGAIRTPMSSHQAAWDMMAGHPGGTEADMIQGGYHYSALKATSFLEPERVAETALYLNSELASSVTGVTIPVDAGHLLLAGINTDPVTS
ncbi:mycofactocin-coupled SDR family oxidoreductase [Amycolatopsis thermophila]|uniref:SDR family mycofactocin-dependent oxidoreductase n=1 Tax=Amycolatopsis thermophila TaxID=206084 RepID=A0ABU0F582_9PSEU|nr:mycofactocin-coupled SDR family oxidoreductase [Amycolatopsis thermophila]MDQ0382745.1 SDR family mycofactocin-dependent oxidoreductase [Amycolatopsis thermophila]